jgi:spore maturation protein CgeB
MTRALKDLENDPALRASLARSGLDTVVTRHSCAHRVDELMGIAERLRAPALESAA